jgi:hypothetical protein
MGHIAHPSNLYDMHFICICSIPRSGDHDFNQFAVVLCHVQFSFSGFIVLKNKIFKGHPPFLYFYDYLPFEEDLAL